MVVFLAKSALCIGAVAAMASGFALDDLAAAAGRGIRAAAEGAGRSCLRSEGCLAAGVGGSMLSTQAAVPPSAWTAPRLAKPAGPAARALRAPAT